MGFGIWDANVSFLTLVMDPHIIFYNKGGQGDTTRRVKSDTFA
jgi:hypothetical protein